MQQSSRSKLENFLVNALIKDGYSGFFIRDFSPAGLASEIISVMNNRKLDDISNNAKKQISEMYSFDAAVYRYKKILE